jgi:hypothetical protein
MKSPSNFDVSIVNNMVETNHTDKAVEPELRHIQQILDDGDSNEDDIVDNFEQDFNSFYKSEEITKEELSAAFLAAFYNGRTSQSSLSDYLKVTNIFSPIKLPTNFDGLKSKIRGKARDLDFTKSWFCGTCLKSIKTLNNRLQRSCVACSTRYVKKFLI